MTVLVTIGLLAPASFALIHNLETSPLDEWVFVDYTEKALRQGFVHRGENVGLYTAELMACHGVIPGSTFGECGSGQEIYSKLPYGGRNGAADYTPVYFWSTAILGGGIQLLSGLDQLTSWRMTGALWLSGAMLMMYLLFRRWKIPNGTTLVLGLLVIGSPYTLWANTFVSTDAPSLFIGATLLYLATRIRAGDLSPWWLVIASPIALAFKVTNMAAIGLAVTYLIGSWVVQLIRRKNTSGHTKLAITSGLSAPILALVASAALELGWLQVLKLTAIPTPPVDQGISTPLTPQELGLQATNFLSSSLSYSPFSSLDFGFIWAPLSWICITGVIGAALILRKWNKRAEVSIAIGIAAVAMAPALAIIFWAVNHSYFQLSPRYGASLSIAFMLSAAFLVRNNLARWIIGGYGTLLILASLLASIQLNLVVPSS
ncbi:hypothetical protein M2119_000011 [Aurantimicrobium minutum]|uniref:hypothetical protein n=1 Tax=Aurantimicrobium minutum TaxID=708131 RepID=UPI002475EA79|nr:hypothetical protein [Aurantimicrobium minutum]MDH6531774.1 hypothetical protein [Aurantimicrobium minutum]